MDILKNGKCVGITSQVEAVGKPPNVGCVFWTTARLIEGEVYELKYDDGTLDKIRIANAPVPDDKRKATRIGAWFVGKSRAARSS